VTTPTARVGAVIVDFHAGALLANCVDSLLSEGVTNIVVVDNAPDGTARDELGDRAVTVTETGVNLGYGRGVNRGVAMLPASEFILVANPDVVVHPGAIAALVDSMSDPVVGIVGPTIFTTQNTQYPSVRVFPSATLATMHAVLGPVWPSNRWTKRYRSAGPDGHVDWVSGAAFLIRRDLFERLGGFDERYFMFGEDMDLCWRAGQAGATVAWCESAIVTHVEGASRARAPRAMIVAHHQGALRFEAQSAQGVRRALVPLAAVLLGARLVVQLVGARRRSS
jgi:N-acetylglucosaminyl-diphospho-decaprenol L-rhamnosyltransferase